MQESPIDWRAAATVAERLGLHTRNLVAGRDAEAVKSWALRLASECNHGANKPRAASYLELAVLLGHVERRPEREEVSDAA
jgi:hypothetical protein